MTNETKKNLSMSEIDAQIDKMKSEGIERELIEEWLHSTGTQFSLGFYECRNYEGNGRYHSENPLIRVA